MLGLERVPAIVREVDTAHERLEMAVIENIQRENLNPVELARAFARLQDEFRLTQREIATRLGKSREVVANTLRLLDLPTYIQEAVGRGEITESHGRLLLAVPDPEAQKKLFEDLLGHRMTTRELRLRVESMKPVKKEPPPSPEIAAVEEKLSSELGAPVKISGGEAGGKITIIFYSAEELRQIAERLGKEKKLEEAG
jgi:ParB family chromosome partitioning protein